MTFRWSHSLLFAGLVGSQALIIMLPVAAQEPVGTKFGSRDPRTCQTRTAALSEATAREYFICDHEYTVGPNASGESIYLVTDVTIDLGSPRPFNPTTDSFGFEDSSIDPSKTIVPVRGSFNDWVCGKFGQIGTTTGKSCNLTPNLHAVGICYTNSFGDWHCTMRDPAAVREFVAAHAPPTQP